MGGDVGGTEGAERERRRILEEHDLPDDPLLLARAWLEEAWERSGLQYPNAVCLSTVDGEGNPDGRVVLVKEIGAEGPVFYTNLRSSKARALAANPAAALTFYWEAMGRQVRIRGEAEPLPPAEADAYFRSRPRGSQIGAWASDQSEAVADRRTLEERFRGMEARFEGEEIPRPSHWGGFLLRPRETEFWVERDFRLHDRFLYREVAGVWRVERLYP